MTSPQLKEYEQETLDAVKQQSEALCKIYNLSGEVTNDHFTLAELHRQHPQTLEDKTRLDNERKAQNDARMDELLAERTKESLGEMLRTLRGVIKDQQKINKSKPPGRNAVKAKESDLPMIFDQEEYKTFISGISEQQLADAAICEKQKEFANKHKALANKTQKLNNAHRQIAKYYDSEELSKPPERRQPIMAYIDKLQAVYDYKKWTAYCEQLENLVKRQKEEEEHLQDELENMESRHKEEERQLKDKLEAANRVESENLENRYKDEQRHLQDKWEAANCDEMEHLAHRHIEEKKHLLDNLKAAHGALENLENRHKEESEHLQSKSEAAHSDELENLEEYHKEPQGHLQDQLEAALRDELEIMVKPPKEEQEQVKLEEGRWNICKRPER